MPSSTGQSKDSARVKRLLKETDALTSQMGSHIEKSYRALEDLETASAATTRLVAGSKRFHKTSKNAKCRACCKAWKIRLMWINAGLLVLSVVMIVIVKFAGICQDAFKSCEVTENPEFYLVCVLGTSLMCLTVLWLVNMKVCCLCFERCNTLCD